MGRVKCSFCGLEYEENEVKVGQEGNICDNCLELISSEKIENSMFVEFDSSHIMKAHEIKNKLDKFVMGQENAKRKIAVEVCNHYKRINFKSKSIELPKSNILLMGPSGCGKTYILETLSNILNIPLAVGDATTLTETGYVGKDVDSLLKTLIDKANGNIQLAEKGIIYIDEIDKIISTKDSGSKSKDVGGEGVQQSLLKMIEGTDYTFERTGQRPITINTKNILFVCGGAFEGITDVIKERISIKTSIGFSSSDNSDKKSKYTNDELLNMVTTEDLIKYGMIKEFIGRLHLITTLNELDEKELKNILTKPKNAIIKQYETLMKLDGISLKFSKDAIDYIASEAKRKGTGARGLKSVISDKLNELMYKLPMSEEKEYEVTKEYLEK